MANENLHGQHGCVIEKSWVDGCFVSKMACSDLLSLMKEWIETRQKNNYITAINVSKFVMMRNDKKMANYILNSAINIADGFPIYIATHLVGDPIPERITGVDLMESLLRLADEHGYRVFFLGSKPHVLDQAVNRCQVQYPKLRIAGARDGYFDKEEEESVVGEIADAAPDILFVGMGLPQKEYFIDDYGSRLNSSVILPVGGAFDVYAGVKRRAPVWVQRLCIEWLWRSLYDRSRAGLIYKSLARFCVILLGEIVKQRLFRRRRESIC